MKPPAAGLQDLLQQAGELKTAQLRDKRPAFTAAPPFAQHTLAFERDAATLALRAGPADDRLDAAEAHKAAGNAALQSTGPEKALEHYSRALALLRYFVTAEGDADRVRRVDADAASPQPTAARAAQLGAALLLNAAHASLQLSRPSDAVWACDEALTLCTTLSDDTHGAAALSAKALYRRSLARLADPASGSEAARLAAADARAALALQPSDPVIKRHAAACAAQAAAASRSARAVAAAAMQSGRLYPEAPAEAAPVSDEMQEAAAEVARQRMMASARDAGLSDDHPLLAALRAVDVRERVARGAASAAGEGERGTKAPSGPLDRLARFALRTARRWPRLTARLTPRRVALLAYAALLCRAGLRVWALLNAKARSRARVEAGWDAGAEL